MTESKNEGLPEGGKIRQDRSVMIYLGILIIMTIVLVFAVKMYSTVDIGNPSCGDGTEYGHCSLRQPLRCDKGLLVEKALFCGCPVGLKKEGNLCISEYQTGLKNVVLKYVLRGKEKEINFEVYEGVVDHISTIPKSISSEGGETPSRKDFKLRNINEPAQRELLLPLVTEIQNVVKSEEDRVRIAVSVVQNIPYGISGNLIDIRGIQVNDSRYPYEVLYDNQGVCGEKGELLAFILREMGYGVVFFYHQEENHEAIGIKCPKEFSLGETGYCFIETTGPAIITDNRLDYIGLGKLHSTPKVILISDGKSLGDNLYEYNDADTLTDLRDNGVSMFSEGKLKDIRDKYGLVEVYRAG
ncbi:hypothetical protein GOV13_03295 [Candidatus Pacearchaeota archaeon]|nr:hypothetical protein [Candidatus Pacearchaeota archaeon]